jgi:phospholipase/carboxylesterase
VFVAHGRRDPVISVEFARTAVARMQAADLAVSYHESDVGHQIDPVHVPAAVAWLAGALPGDAA